ncbi:MAG: hypothetical protein QW334_04160 [Thermofilum sp.]
MSRIRESTRVVEHCHALRVYEEVPRLEVSVDFARYAAGLHPHHQQGGALLHPHVEALKQRQCLELREDDIVPFRSRFPSNSSHKRTIQPP